MGTILAVWKFVVNLKIEATEDSTYIFQFSCSQDKDLVIHLSPWNLKGHLLILQHWALEMIMNEVDLSLATFWIQLHGLPMAGMNKKNITDIGASVGSLVEMEALLDIFCKRFFRIKVSFNNPLKDGFFLPRPHLSAAFIRFRYEKLVDFCYQCGCLGHSVIMCPYEAEVIPTTKFGPWLRASALG